MLTISTDILENVNPDLSDTELIEQEAPHDAPTPAVSDLGDAQTPGDIGEGDESEGSVENDEEGDNDIDEELAAELDLALENEDDEDDGDDEDDEDDESEEEDSEDDDDEDTQAKKLLSEEIRDLEAAVSKKRNEIASSANPLIRVFELCVLSWRNFLPGLLETLRGCFEEAHRGHGDEKCLNATN